jgi:hypothetical protein
MAGTVLHRYTRTIAALQLKCQQLCVLYTPVAVQASSAAELSVLFTCTVVPCSSSALYKLWECSVLAAQVAVCLYSTTTTA